MKYPLIVTVVCIVIGIMLISVIGKHISEGYDPADMGGRKYYGFGRGGYGYSVFDTGAPEQCYQTTPLDSCREGYHRTINKDTLAPECCVNPTNYGFYFPSYFQ